MSYLTVPVLPKKTNSKKMQYPDFCEYQFQELYNSEFAHLWPHKPPGYFPPVVVSLPKEKQKGWDTGYNLPWLGKVSPENNFCNLFIQYKLSHVCDHPTCGQYNYWQQPYFRFIIPHLISSYGGRNRQNSYHQFRALSELASKGFAVYYATNSTLSNDELFNWALNKQITQMSPLLNVGNINQEHEYVTFTKESDYFLLHSENYKIEKMSFKMVKSEILDSRRSSLKEDLQLFPSILAEYQGIERIYRFYTKEYKAESLQATWMILHYIVSISLNVTWMKLVTD